MKIVIVEDDPEVASTISMAFSLRWPEAQVQVHEMGGEALKSLKQDPVDLIILDYNLPDMDGISILQGIREYGQTPVLMLTVRNSEQERVRGLLLGADDYMGKPFSPFELIARATALMRRAAPVKNGHTPVMYAGPLSLNPDTTEVFVSENLVKLSPTEFKILSLLVQNKGKVVARDAIIKDVWGINPSGSDAHLVKLHIQHIRRKLEKFTESELIISVPRFGYRIAG